MPKAFVFSFKIQRKLFTSVWNQNNQDGEKEGGEINIINSVWTNERGEQSAPSSAHKVTPESQNPPFHRRSGFDAEYPHSLLFTHTEHN